MNIDVTAAITAYDRRCAKWDRRFLELARFIAQWSKDPSTKVGAVIVNSDNSIVSVGYNGFPRNVVDSDERLNNRELKYKLVVHAERNAILFAKQTTHGCTLYTWPFMSCAACAGMVIQAGITRVVAPSNLNPRWQEDFKLTRQMFDEACVGLLETNFPTAMPLMTDLDQMIANLTLVQQRCDELLEENRNLKREMGR